MAILGILGSILGLVVSLYIYRKKRAHKILACPREGGCERVVHSIHSRTFGIRNELLGFLFYLVQGAFWVTMLIAPSTMSDGCRICIVLLTGAGVLFTGYLIVLQAFVIRAWCAWCLGSTLATALLAVAACSL